jgi:hypothetical protein
MTGRKPFPNEYLMIAPLASTARLGRRPLPRSWPFAICMLVGLLACPALPAQTALSNLGQPLSGGSYTAGGSISSFNFGEAVHFTTGPSAVDFTGATFLLFLANPYSAATNFQVTLNSGFNSSGTTGLLATLTGNPAPALTVTPATFAYTATVPVPLAANTTYWLQVDAFGTATHSEIGWAATDNIGAADPGALPGWSYSNGVGTGYDMFFTNTGGSSWNPSGFSGVNFPQFSVEYQTAAVPEPNACVGIMGLAAAGLVCWSRRRRA